MAYGKICRVLRDEKDISLTRTQIFDAVWNMDSDSCHSSVVKVIYTLQEKIEPDSKNPTYIKTVLGIGYKFDVKMPGNAFFYDCHSPVIFYRSNCVRTPSRQSGAIFLIFPGQIRDCIIGVMAYFYLLPF